MRKGKITICITTGEIYESALKAADAHDMKYSKMIDVLRGKSPSYHGKVFAYMEEAPYRMNQIIEATRAAHHNSYRKQIEIAEVTLRKAQEAEAKAHADVVAAEQKLTALRAEFNR
jgi:uncharacterized coiled-coil DUF342 family protein